MRPADNTAPDPIGPSEIAGVVFDVNTLVYSLAAIVVGFQLIVFAIFAKI